MADPSAASSAAVAGTILGFLAAALAAESAATAAVENSPGGKENVSAVVPLAPLEAPSAAPSVAVVTEPLPLLAAALAAESRATVAVESSPGGEEDGPAVVPPTPLDTPSATSSVAGTAEPLPLLAAAVAAESLVTVTVECSPGQREDGPLPDPFELTWGIPYATYLAEGPESLCPPQEASPPTE